MNKLLFENANFPVLDWVSGQSLRLLSKNNFVKIHKLEQNIILLRICY